MHYILTLFAIYDSHVHVCACNRLAVLFHANRWCSKLCRIIHRPVLRFRARVCDSYNRFVSWHGTWDAT